ncbi:branched-chain amino acid ABC transporter permease [Mycolicibacterium murale]|uniref:Branched-chain amino acid ABC transporter permease n=1 Tax=Mycolicibacterium murale TaxID=182220 RepID=A0A7I9WWL9_9MYCO|nr:branched-chain amino acid ABC transporter permease [Mycolicibacterium murale]MCV7185640.1 branched-chain amino acid ABC transporter permease [Mycolicibacterium murale]GFG61750.1 branched-chain amino acid ABC transporter permease [Mycolicibacterium murale]
MSADLSFYIVTLLVYASVAVIGCWGLDVQYSDTGLLNLSYIVSVAVGGYAVALLSLGPPEDETGTVVQEYFWGADLPFPLPFVGAVLAGMLISLPIGLVALRRLRSDYQAVAMLSVALIASALVVAVPGMLGGGHGLYLIPAPLKEELGLKSAEYSWVYAAFAVLLTALAGWVVLRISRSPLWRVLRAVRENPEAADAIGVNVTSVRLTAFAVGNGLGALSGAVLASFIGTYAPADWSYQETLILMGAAIVGGAGNRFGVLMGALLLPVGLAEATRYLPQFGAPGTVDALQFVVVGLVIIGFLWWRPQGVFPERKRTFDIDGNPVPFYAKQGATR